MNLRTPVGWAALPVLWLLGCGELAAARYVSTTGSNTAPYATPATAARSLQPALEAAAEGETIYVAAGEYAVTQQVSVTKGVRLEGASGAIIRAGGTTRCLYVNHADAVVTGFRLTGGWDAVTGGGLLINGLGGTVSYCELVGNATGAYGGGATLAAGVIEHCTIMSNTVVYGGGGVMMASGGAVRDSIIAYNTGADYGGGIHMDQGGVIERCFFLGNPSTGNGGGVNINVHGSIRNSVFFGNHAEASGGGIYASGGSLDHCTLSGNSADGQGGGAYLINGADIRHSIIFHNTADTEKDLRTDIGGETSYCCVPGIRTTCITNDPLFVNQPQGILALRPGSPCIDRGLAGVFVTAGGDIHGKTRVMDGNHDLQAVVDMGAYEYPAIARTTDFDRDGRSDIGCYYAPGGNWYLFRSGLGQYETQFGYAGTVPVTGDFDGDGKTDFGCYYPPGGNWYLFRSSLGQYETQFGYAGTIPVTGDFDGDGKTDFGCYYPPGAN